MSGAKGAGDRKVRVKVRRSDPDARDTFLVERADPMTVLDLLISIQRNHDPSLAFRHSCRVAMCNMCGVRVDGEPMLACKVPLRPDQDELLIEPMESAPVVRDLVVDADQFVDEWARDTGG